MEAHVVHPFECNVSFLFQLLTNVFMNIVFRIDISLLRTLRFILFLRVSWLWPVLGSPYMTYKQLAPQTPPLLIHILSYICLHLKDKALLLYEYHVMQLL